MKTINIDAVETFTSEMERLRRLDYGNTPSDDFSNDEFDARSTYILATCESEPIGMVRLTENLPSPLQSWLGENSSIPKGGGVIELTRGVVAKEWRGYDIFKLLLAETLIKVKELGAKAAVTAVVPEANHCRILSEIGFQNTGKTLIYNHPQVGDLLVQRMIQQPQTDFEKVIEARTKIINGEKLKEFNIVSSIAVF